MTKPGQRAPVGAGTPSWRQIARAVPVAISLWRGIAVVGALPDLATAVLSEVAFQVAALH